MIFRVQNTFGKLLLLSTFFALTFALQASMAAQKLRVTVSIRPIHSIAAAIMTGVSSPQLLIESTQSAHHASLKPSQARLLANSDLFIWTGPLMEEGLVKPVAVLAKSVDRLVLLDSDIEKLSNSTGYVDPHVWLSSKNARRIGKVIAQTLGRLDPDNKQTYMANLESFRSRVNALEKTVTATLGSSKPGKLLIYHDSLLYFSKQFGREFKALTTGPEEITPSAKQISEIGKLLRSGDYACLFVEAGENEQRIKSIGFSDKTQLIVFDPIGNEFASGGQLYFDLMGGLAQKIASCGAR